MGPSTMYDVNGVLLPRPFAMGRLGHFGLYVRDLTVSARFYQDLLGYRVTDVLAAPEENYLDGAAQQPDPRGVFLTYNSDHHAMVLIHASVGRSRGPAYDRGVTLNQMSFQVSTLREVMDAHALFTREHQQVRRVGRDVPGSNWAVYFPDPDGHTVELYYGMEQIGWNRRSKPVEFFSRFGSSEAPELPQPSELDEVITVADAGEDIDSGTQWNETRPARFDVGGVLLPRPFRVVNEGPISLFVADVEASIAFYRDRLGMAVTEEITYAGRRVAFLRTGTEHHTLTLLPLELRARIGWSDHTTIAACGMQVAGYRQLRDAAAFLRAEGVTVVEMPPELHTGVDHAVHVVDPDGHCVQLYCEMEQVGTGGRPLSAAERRPAGSPWPDQLRPVGETSPNPTFQGPLG